MSSPIDEVDPRRIRVGLVIVTAAFLTALVLAVLVEDPLGRMIMIGVALVAAARAYLVVRSLRRDQMTE